MIQLDYYNINRATDNAGKLRQARDKLRQLRGKLR
jgi:hypothetical protein